MAAKPVEEQGGEVIEVTQPTREQPAAGHPPSQAAPPAVPPSDFESQLDEEDEGEKVVFSRDGREEAEMDMTPMVDVTFLLLIFFMVTAAFAMQKSLEIPAPTNNEASTVSVPQEQDEDPDFVTIEVDAYNTFRVISVDWEEECPSEQEMLIQLRLAKQGSKDGRVPSKLLVKANADAMHEYVVMALDAGNEVQMEQIQLQLVEGDE